MRWLQCLNSHAVEAASARTGFFPGSKAMDLRLHCGGERYFKLNAGFQASSGLVTVALG